MKTIFSLLFISSILFSQDSDAFLQAEKHFENKAYEKALALLEDLIDDNDELAKYHYLAAKCSYELKAYEDAVDYMEDAIELESGNLVYLKFYNEAMIKYGDDVSFFSMISFVKKMRTNWENILKLEPENAEMNRLLARYYLFAPGFIGKDLEKGLQYVEDLRKLDANLADELLIDYYLKEEKDEAKALKLLAENSDQNSFFVLKNKLTIYQSKKATKRALDIFETIHENHYKTENTTALYNQFGYYLIAEKKFAEAIRVLSLMKDKAADEANSYDSLGDAYRANGQFDKAKENYRKAIAIDPNFSASLKNLNELNSN